MGEAKCGIQAVEFACLAGIYDQGGRVLICSPDTLLRILRVAAWYAIRHADHPDEDYETFRNREPSPLGLAAFSASAPGRTDRTIEQLIEQVRIEAESSGSKSATRQGQVFQAILGMELAAMLGHEASHLEEKPPFCAIAELSRIEEVGLWTILLRVSSSGELYKPASPDRGEVAADRCAARRIRLERSLLAASPLPDADKRFVLRAAADIVSTMLVSREVGSATRPVFRLNGAYLYSPLRILALVGEIGAGEPGPMVCGGAAENLVEVAQDTFKAAPGNGLMPDEMEHAFPRGVVDAWERRSSWSRQSYSCH